MKVRLSIFSGLPDPVWDLTEAEVEELRRRLRDLPVAQAAPAPPDLGYRGFEVSDSVRGPAGAPDEEIARIHVYDGTITLLEGGPGRHHRDSHDLEGWLAEMAVARGFPAPELDSRD